MSRLVTVIVSWLTVTEAGTNLKLSIVTASVPALGGDCDEPLDVGCCDALGFAAPCALCELSELPQPRDRRRHSGCRDEQGGQMSKLDGMLHSVTAEDDELARSYERRYAGQDGNAHR